MADRKSCLELLDETFHWLRRLPARTWLTYAACATPFYLFALRELQQLSTGQIQTVQLASLALLSACYLLYGFGRSAFAAGFNRHIRRERQVSRTPFRSLANHLLLHAAELATLPIALLSIAGFPWILGFFRCALIRREARLRVLLSEAAQQSSSCYLETALCSVIVLSAALATVANLMMSAVAAPEVFKSLTGYEIELTRNRSLVLNATTFAAVIGFTGLLCETLLLGYFCLAQFYRESQTNAHDLFLLLDEIPKETAA